MNRFLVYLLLLISFGQVAVAGTKPISGMPDYNGTYWGTPNTGAVCDSRGIRCDSLGGLQMFTTLYRDNYTRVSGCAGERCGSHAGVDIAVVSGTPVRAALAGTVVVSGCKEGPGSGDFGGTIVIEAVSPYVIVSKVYLVYAHLDDWDDYSVGSYVEEGAVIGLSGGKLKSEGGICPGGSKGEHLHFQVDKSPPDAEGRPWYPKKIFADGAEHADTGFDLPKYTHNPLPFVLRYAYNFTFAEKGNKELWDAKNMNAFGVAGSALWMDSESAQPLTGRSSYFTERTCSFSDGKPCSREITLDADTFKHLALRLDFKCIANPVVIHYRGQDDVWHAGTFSYSTSALYRLSLSGLTYWHGIITDVIIQPSRGCTADPGPREYFIHQAWFYK